jgi:spoIIIJ-associated protein
MKGSFMSENTNERVRAIVVEVLAKMGVTGEVTLTEKVGHNEQREVYVDIQTVDSRLLIGERGANLSALQHLVRVLVAHSVDEKFTLLLDVNKYREEKRAQLEELARRAMQKVKTTGQLVILRPMSAYERRMVHTVIAEDTSLATESIGEEPNRRVVVKQKKERQTLDEVSSGIQL